VGLSISHGVSRHRSVLRYRIQVSAWTRGQGGRLWGRNKFPAREKGRKLSGHEGEDGDDV